MTTSSVPIRILIVDDHPIVRNGLALMIKYELGMETAAEASSGTEAIAQFRQHRPDVTLINLRLGDMGVVQPGLHQGNTLSQGEILQKLI